MSNSSKVGIEYPFDGVPQKGEWIEVAKGIYWLQMSLPMALDHINLYVLEDNEGWWIVDTGIKLGDTRERWELLLANQMSAKPVLGVICTHMHPDHVGQAGWLCDSLRVPLYMSAQEYLSARVFTTMPQGEVSWTAERHYRRAGLGDDYLQSDGAKRRGFGFIVEPLPLSYNRLKDGQHFTIGGREWRVMTGAGHSPEHVSLYCEADKLMLSGDQIIPRITSNVSVMPSEPEANPLQDWFDGLRRFRRDIDADTLVMPAHNAPFYGVHPRLDYLIAHHEGHLAAIEKACVEPQKAINLFGVLFSREIGSSQLELALGEVIAHLHFLCAEGRMTRVLDEDGVYCYQTLDINNCPYQAVNELDEGPMEV
ncbi:Hydroxyacylglutathione hydrolase [Zhongshania aliphaticivorans]|uniref:Hydroxyacylglutathione hydrolase n=1 Tax=Zhongshania aliphaticivorans TaxID=1470434 RepID=A0A5S9NDT0_9GAMM|nr:MBL fold metallo-hydrolase [Zhongshania aliphaticivorans]CAA0088494.1 Hydroxyacylglutathione hydrolase [Zhongshania aliphaticivorans]CAA0094507.1 Hydroxyacylglutathione hydrolase [Zhongshania aliphaticivorans]